MEKIVFKGNFVYDKKDDHRVAERHHPSHPKKHIHDKSNSKE